MQYCRLYKKSNEVGYSFFANKKNALPTYVTSKYKELVTVTNKNNARYVCITYYLKINGDSIFFFFCDSVF